MRRPGGSLVAATILAAVLVVGPLTGSRGARAASDLVERVQGLLYAGRTADAAALAQTDAARGDDEARFALGTVEFLQSVERLAKRSIAMA